MTPTDVVEIPQAKDLVTELVGEHLELAPLVIALGYWTMPSSAGMESGSVGRTAPTLQLPRHPNCRAHAHQCKQAWRG